MGWAAGVLALSLLVTGVDAAGQDVIPLYSGAAPGTEDWKQEEKEYFSPSVGGKVVTNVTQPRLTAYLPEESAATGTAVIIAPGGGFHILSIDSEGVEVAKWLQERGVAAFVLRYRLFPTGDDGVKELGAKFANLKKLFDDMGSVAPFAGADGLAAVRHVRENAKKYGVAPDKIGFMGFSAGGAVTMHVATKYDKASRPDFVAPIYAGGSQFEDARVPADAPPIFVLAATDDPLGLADDSVMIYSKWLAAGKPAELHIYSRGGHGFGMKSQNLPSDAWIDRFGEWLGVQALLAREEKP